MNFQPVDETAHLSAELPLLVRDVSSTGSRLNFQHIIFVCVEDYVPLFGPLCLESIRPNAGNSPLPERERRDMWSMQLSSFLVEEEPENRPLLDGLATSSVSPLSSWMTSTFGNLA